MKHRVPLLLFVLLLLGAGVWLAAESTNSEPAYNGKSLDAWLEQYQTNSMPPNPRHNARADEAAAAIRHIGTNALPTLLRMVRAKDSALKKRVMSLTAKHHLLNFNLRSADYYHSAASDGFSILRSDAKPLVPDLIASLNDPDQSVRTSAANALGQIGPAAKDAVPALIRQLDDRSQPVVIIETMFALQGIRAHAEIAVPALLQFINGPRKQWNYSIYAVMALQGYGKSAKAASPALQGLLNDPDLQLRNMAQNTLHMIDPDPLKKAPAR